MYLNVYCFLLQQHNMQQQHIFSTPLQHNKVDNIDFKNNNNNVKNNNDNANDDSSSKKPNIVRPWVSTKVDDILQLHTTNVQQSTNNFISSSNIFSFSFINHPYWPLVSTNHNSLGFLRDLNRNQPITKLHLEIVLFGYLKSGQDGRRLSFSEIRTKDHKLSKNLIHKSMCFCIFSNIICNINFRTPDRPNEPYFGRWKDFKFVQIILLIN